MFCTASCSQSCIHINLFNDVVVIFRILAGVLFFWHMWMFPLPCLPINCMISSPLKLLLNERHGARDIQRNSTKYIVSSVLGMSAFAAFVKIVSSVTSKPAYWIKMFISSWPETSHRSFYIWVGLQPSAPCFIFWL